MNRLYYEPATNATQSEDRIIKLTPIEGVKPQRYDGLPDKKLFTGENELHAVANGTLWHLKYKSGALPPALANKQWTNFTRAYEAAKKYYNARGVDIKEVINA